MATSGHKKESIDWSSVEAQEKQLKPRTKLQGLTALGRQIISESNICKGFCGGKKCKYCQPLERPIEEMAITGLFSHWVTDNILACSRPSTELIKEYHIVEQFKDKGIKSIINLQKPGEHKSCGYPLKEMGFSYSPSDFMDHGIFFYNFGWPDFGVGSLANVLDMVRVMQFALSEGKVAVHCHAGLGRTGVMIACYLVYCNRMNPKEAVLYIRDKRPGAVQTHDQVDCVEEFYKYLCPLRIVFSRNTETLDFTLTQFLIRQKHLLHGYEARSLRYIPKIISVSCERLLQMANRVPEKLKDTSHSKVDSVHMMKKVVPGAFVNENLDSKTALHGSVSSSSLSSVRLMAPSLLHPSRSTENIADSRNKEARNETSEDSDDELYDRNPIKRHNPDIHSSDRLHRHNSRTEAVVLAVARAVGEAEYCKNVLEKVKCYKDELNADNEAWTLLYEEDDPLVLSALMWDWLEHLQEPVINGQDLPQMLKYVEEPLLGLERLDKGTRQTLMFIFKFLSSLAPLPDTIFIEAIQRCLSALTHQIIPDENDALQTTEDKYSDDINGTNKEVMRKAHAVKLMAFSVCLLEILSDIEH